jgi:hypothetical protein
MPVTIDDDLRSAILHHLAQLNAEAESVKSSEDPETLDKERNQLFLAWAYDSPADALRCDPVQKEQSSKETFFGKFIEQVSREVALRNPNFANVDSGGTHGVDLRLVEHKTKRRVLISVKSGKNWGNSSQWKQQHVEFSAAAKSHRKSYDYQHTVGIVGQAWDCSVPAILSGSVFRIGGQAYWWYLSGGNRELCQELGVLINRKNNPEWSSQIARVQTLSALEQNPRTREILIEITGLDSHLEALVPKIHRTRKPGVSKALR